MSVNVEGKKLNPWFSILTRPKSTIQYLTENKPKYMVIILAGLIGIYRALSDVLDADYETNTLIIKLITAVIVGPLFGVLWVFVYTAFIGFSGKWLGGKGEFINIRCAFVWSHIPILYSSIIFFHYILPNLSCVL